MYLFIGVISLIYLKSLFNGCCSVPINCCRCAQGFLRLTEKLDAQISYVHGDGGGMHLPGIKAPPNLLISRHTVPRSECGFQIHVRCMSDSSLCKVCLYSDMFGEMDISSTERIEKQ